MLRGWAIMIMVTACVSVGAKARAENTATDADVQCIVVGARISESADPRQRTSGEMLLTYFLGRIDGRSPNVDLETLIVREARRMSPADITRAAHRCGKEFSARGPEMVRIGKALVRSGK